MAEADEAYVLIVEDEDGVRLTLRDFFNSRGLPVLVASDGVGAIKQILDYNVKVIVTDYRMEVFGGEYWMKFLEKFCGEKTVIITSGFLRPEFSIPFETIYKPFDYGVLAEKVEKVLRE